MPCDDITEQIKITLDKEERLLSYHLMKRACGKRIGSQISIIDNLRRKNVDEIIAVDRETFIENGNTGNDVDMFIKLKHLFAIQMALAVYRGAEPGGPNDICSIAEIGFDGENSVIDADIRIDLITSKIEACGFCNPARENKIPKK